MYAWKNVIIVRRHSTYETYGGSETIPGTGKLSAVTRKNKHCVSFVKSEAALFSLGCVTLMFI
jgi:hypothetical protein